MVNNLIFLDEQRIRKQLKIAQEYLIVLRTLICEGEEVPKKTLDTAEKTINDLEGQLKNLIIGQ